MDLIADRFCDLTDAEKAFIAMSAPEHISPILIFLCSEEAANVNARVFNVGGGKFGLYNEPEVIGWVVGISTRVAPCRRNKGRM